MVRGTGSYFFYIKIVIKHHGLQSFSQLSVRHTLFQDQSYYQCQLLYQFPRFSAINMFSLMSLQPAILTGTFSNLVVQVVSHYFSGL